MRWFAAAAARTFAGMAEHIQIDSTLPLITYQVGSLARDEFVIPFAYFENGNLVVTVGADVLVSSGYTISGTAVDAGFSGGTVTLDTAVTDTTVTIQRVVPVERTTDFPLSGPFSIRALNTQLDKIVAMIQTTVVTASTLSQRLTDWIALFTTLSNSDTTVTLFDTRNAITLATVGAGVSHIRTAGYAAVGDGGHALYKRVALAPSHPGKVQSANGTWFELAETILSPLMFGAKTDQLRSYSQELQDAVDTSAALQGTFTGIEIVFPVGPIQSNTLVTGTKGITIRGAGPGFTGQIYPHLPGASGSSIVTNSTTHGIFHFQTADAVVIENMGFGAPERIVSGGTGQATSGTLVKISPPVGLATDNLSNYGSVLRNVRTRAGFIAIELNACHSATLDHVIVDAFESVGIYIHSNANYPDNGIINLFSAFVQGYADSVIAIYIQPGSNIDIISPKISYCQNAIVLGVTGNASGNNASGTLHIFGGSIEQQTTNSIWIKQETANTYYGQVQIIGVQFLTLNNGISPSFQKLINIATGAQQYLQKVIISNNILIQQIGNPGNGVVTIGDGADVLVQGNIIQGDTGVTTLCGILVNGNATAVKLLDNAVAATQAALRYLLAVPALVRDSDAFTVATIPANCAKGSQIYVDDAKRTSNTDPTVVALGTGGICHRNSTAWHTLAP